MKRLFILPALVVALLIAGAALAQSPKQPPIALHEQERAAAASASQAIESAQADRGKAWVLIQQTPVTDGARAAAAIAVAQQVEARVSQAEALRDGLLWKLGAGHGCAECELTTPGIRLFNWAMAMLIYIFIQYIFIQVRRECLRRWFQGPPVSSLPRRLKNSVWRRCHEYFRSHGHGGRGYKMVMRLRNQALSRRPWQGMELRMPAR